MKKNKCLNLLVLSFISLSLSMQSLCEIDKEMMTINTPQTEGKSVGKPGELFNLKAEQNDTLNGMIAEEIDKHLDQAIKQLAKTDLLLEDLSQIVQNGLVKTTSKNKLELILQIKSLRKMIQQISKNPFTDADLSTVNFLLSLNKAVIDHIQKAIRKGFKKLPQFDIENVIPHKRITSFEQLEEKRLKNELLLEKLKKSSQSVGLSWVNRIYRKTVASPIEFASKHSLFSKAIGISILGLGTIYILHHFTDQLDELLGEAPEVDRWGNLKNEGVVKWFGRFEHKISQFSSGLLPIGSLLVALIPKRLNKEWKTIKRWGSKKAKHLHNRLKGGIPAKQAQQDYGFTNPRFTFDNVVGLEHIKKELQPVINYIKHCSRFERVGIGPEKGYLFAGKPGTGKSFMAEALAGEIAKTLAQTGESVKFIPFEASEILELVNERGVGDAIDAILGFAKKNAPCIVFIDEPDLLGLQRTDNRELLSKLLNSMNGFLSNDVSENVILLAATNRPDNLDPALRRRGRFGKIIYFDYPTFEERRKYLTRSLNPIVADLAEFDLEKIARESEGSTFEGLQSMVRKAFQTTKIMGKSLEQKDLENALNEEIRHIVIETKNMPEREQKIIAAQQAARALTNMLLKPAEKLACVTINPVMKEITETAVWDRYYKKEEKMLQQGKIFTYKEKDAIGIETEQDLISVCKMNLAGSIGEELLLGSSGHSYKKESKKRALEIALSLVSEGLDLESLPKKVKNKYYVKAIELMENYKKDVKTLLENNKSKLETLSEALLQHKTLDAEQVNAIIKLDEAKQQGQEQSKTTTSPNINKALAIPAV